MSIYTVHPPHYVDPLIIMAFLPGISKGRFRPSSHVSLRSLTTDKCAMQYIEEVIVFHLLNLCNKII
jgi:hypothetical protein